MLTMCACNSAKCYEKVDIYVSETDEYYIYKDGMSGMRNL